MFVVLLGPPGAGKGTQSQLLSERLGVSHLATGDIFRAAIQEGTPLGQKAKPFIERGELVPDELTVQTVREQFAKPENQRGAVLDGFPRTVEQAQRLDQLLQEMGKQVDAVIYLTVPEDELVRRLTRRWTCQRCGVTFDLQKNPPQTAGRCDVCQGQLYQRPDDTPEVVRHRLQVYLRRTAPVVEYYRAKGLLIEIDGNRPIEAVTASILEALQAKSSVNMASRCRSR